MSAANICHRDVSLGNIYTRRRAVAGERLLDGPGWLVNFDCASMEVAPSGSADNALIPSPNEPLSVCLRPCEL